jgi:hypothetical protein
MLGQTIMRPLLVLAFFKRADLSLDEPEFKGMLFEDEEGESGTEP